MFRRLEAAIWHRLSCTGTGPLQTSWTRAAWPGRGATGLSVFTERRKMAEEKFPGEEPGVVGDDTNPADQSPATATPRTPDPLSAEPKGYPDVAEPDSDAGQEGSPSPEKKRIFSASSPASAQSGCSSPREEGDQGLLRGFRRRVRGYGEGCVRGRGGEIVTRDRHRPEGSAAVAPSLVFGIPCFQPSPR